MNIDEAFQHYREGTATEEEARLVREQIDLANALLKDEDRRGATFAEADEETVKKAKKKFKWQYIVVPVCTIIALLLCIAAILGGVFGSAASYAKKQIVYERSACAQIAQKEAFACQQDGRLDVGATSAGDFVVKDTDAEFNFNALDIKESFYSCFVKLYFDGQRVATIEVDTRTGKVMNVRFAKID